MEIVGKILGDSYQFFYLSNISKHVELGVSHSGLLPPTRIWAQKKLFLAVMNFRSYIFSKSL